MGEIINRKLASSKDPIFGIEPKNIALEITEKNWEEKATIRIQPSGDWIYLWIDEAKIKGEKQRYQVCTKAKDKSRQTLGNFDELDEALEHANAQKGMLKKARKPKNAKESK